MWPFGRRRRPEHDRQEPEVGTPVAEPADAGWPSLAPLPTTLTTSHPVSLSAAFESTLTTRQPLSFVRSLDHAVGRQAPAGEVVGLASPSTAQRRRGEGPVPVLSVAAPLPAVQRLDAGAESPASRPWFSAEDTVTPRPANVDAGVDPLEEALSDERRVDQDAAPVGFDARPDPDDDAGAPTIDASAPMPAGVPSVQVSSTALPGAPRTPAAVERAGVERARVEGTDVSSPLAATTGSAADPWAPPSGTAQREATDERGGDVRSPAVEQSPSGARSVAAGDAADLAADAEDDALPVAPDIDAAGSVTVQPVAGWTDARDLRPTGDGKDASGADVGDLDDAPAGGEADAGDGGRPTAVAQLLGAGIEGLTVQRTAGRSERRGGSAPTSSPRPATEGLPVMPLAVTAEPSAREAGRPSTGPARAPDLSQDDVRAAPGAKTDPPAGPVPPPFRLAPPDQAAGIGAPAPDRVNPNQTPDRRPVAQPPPPARRLVVEVQAMPSEPSHTSGRSAEITSVEGEPSVGSTSSDEEGPATTGRRAVPDDAPSSTSQGELRIGLGSPLQPDEVPTGTRDLLGAEAASSPFGILSDEPAWETAAGGPPSAVAWGRPSREDAGEVRPALAWRSGDAEPGRMGHVEAAPAAEHGAFVQRSTVRPLDLHGSPARPSADVVQAMGEASGGGRLAASVSSSDHLAPPQLAGRSAGLAERSATRADEQRHPAGEGDDRWTAAAVRGDDDVPWAATGEAAILGGDRGIAPATGLHAEDGPGPAQAGLRTVLPSSQPSGPEPAAVQRAAAQGDLAAADRWEPVSFGSAGVDAASAIDVDVAPGVDGTDSHPAGRGRPTLADRPPLNVDDGAGEAARTSVFDRSLDGEVGGRSIVGSAAPGSPVAGPPAPQALQVGSSTSVVARQVAGPEDLPPRTVWSAAGASHALGGESAAVTGAGLGQHSVQMEAASLSRESDAPEPATGATPPTAPAGAPTSAASGGAVSGAELDELARRLYGRIRTHLQRELLLDRERLGRIATRR